MTSVVALVAVLMTYTETPGMRALLVSWTTPVMLPRSDCARQRAGIARATTASTITNERRITICTSERTVLVRGWSNVAEYSAPNNNVVYVVDTFRRTP